MDEKLLATVKEKFQSRETDDLLAIWNEENRDEWSDEAFEAIRQILASRGHDLPPKVPTGDIDKQVKSSPPGPRGNDYVCTHCHVAFTQDRPIQRSFLGYGKFECPKCGESNRYPLSKGYKIFYWLFVVGVAALCVGMFRQGNILLPGLAWIAAVVALGNNGYARRQVQKAWYEHERKGQPRIDVPPMTERERTAVSDPIRWYHVLFALLLPYAALPWGIVNLVRKKRRSGLLMTIVPLVFVLLCVIAGLIGGFLAGSK